MAWETKEGGKGSPYRLPRAAASASPRKPLASHKAHSKRPPSRVDSATLYPSPSLPMRLVADTSQSVKISSQQAVALMPSFFSSLPTLKPGVPFSTTRAVIPFSPFGGRSEEHTSELQSLTNL